MLVSKCHTGCPFAVTCFSQQPLSSVRDSMGTIKHYKLLVTVACVTVRPGTQHEWAPSPARAEPGCFRKASKSVLKPIASSSHKTLCLRTKRGQATAHSVAPSLAHCSLRTAGRCSPSRGLEGSKAESLQPWSEWQGVCAMTSSGQSPGSYQDLSPVQVPLGPHETAAPTGRASTSSPLLW